MATAPGQPPRRFAGVMTGTSMDAIDVAIVSLRDAVTLGHVSTSIELVHLHSRPLDGPLIEAMMELQQSSDDELHRAALIANAYADAVSRALLECVSGCGLTSADLCAVGVHGQTVRHQPGLGYTIQLNAPARIAEATGLDVVSDFRSRDIAAGGQGAPLVPAFHQAIFGDQGVSAVVNIGGIANISWLGDPPRGHDTGPGNMLMDAWAKRHIGKPFDDKGQWASGGTVHPALLAAMLADAYFLKPAPKSTGREAFNLPWLERLLAQSAFASVGAQDVQASLLALTAQSIAKEYADLCAAHRHTAQGLAGQGGRLLVCGGGAKNDALMRAIDAAISSVLAERGLGPCVIESTTACGWDPQAIEAAAFAWLASRAIDRLTGNVPAVTGAIGERVLGSITPAAAARQSTPASGAPGY